MRSIRQLSPNQSALWTVYELVSAQALRPSWHSYPVPRAGHAVSRLVSTVRRLVIYVRRQVKALLSRTGAQGSRVNAVTWRGRTTVKWRWSSVATSSTFRRSASAMTDASLVPSGRSAYCSTKSAIRA
jgi:hypothetical protein